MPSTIAWLDTSAEEQRRVREIVALFSQSESRDELGIGQIRDALSDLLFPGTSVIQTRARYFLFVPWIFRDGEYRGWSGAALKAWAERQERILIESLRRAGATDGLIGSLAGPAVKTLPSTIYWSGLQRFGILLQDAPPDRLAAALGGQPADLPDELADRQPTSWLPTLPPAPSGFPHDVPDGFRLAYAEAAWLRERIVETAPDTLLQHLITGDSPPDEGSTAPWADGPCRLASASVQELVDHAWLFSLSLHGAALLYNLLVGERYERQGLTTIPHPVEDYRWQLGDWAQQCRAAAGRLANWDRQMFWSLVRSRNPRVGPATRLFVDTWLDAVCRGVNSSVADDPHLRGLVASRERRQKGAQSRLVNDRLLRTWSGRSGSDALTYRWQQVRRLVVDIRNGLGAADAGP